MLSLITKTFAANASIDIAPCAFNLLHHVAGKSAGHAKTNIPAVEQPKSTAADDPVVKTPKPPQHRPRKPKTGILLLNMGGPEKLEHVQQFLHRLFSDRDLMTLPAQKWMSKWIAARRTPSIREKYRQIGGGSPILKWTKMQGELLVDQLSQLAPEFGPYKYYVGFRYAEPLTDKTLEVMELDGCEHAVAFSQYPQYTCSTTGSSLNEIARYYGKRSLPSNMRWTTIDRWPTHPGLIEAHADNIQKELLKFPAAVRNDVVILFSAHSLPLKVISRGDTYTAEVSATALRVMDKLHVPNPYRVCWQSKVGPLPWMTPATNVMLAGLSSKGWRNALLVPISFVNDHIETLHELDIEYADELATQVGMHTVRRAASLNDHPVFIRTIAELVKNHLVSRESSSSSQLRMRCPGCYNESCADMRRFFFGHDHQHQPSHRLKAI